MAIKFVSLLTLFFFFNEFSISQFTDESGLPKFTFSWSNDKNKFKSGEIAVIMIKFLGNFDGNASLGQSGFNPTVTVNGKIGNSSYISGVSLDLSEDISNWKICFTPIMVGIFNIVIDDENFKVVDSSLHFQRVLAFMSIVRSISQYSVHKIRKLP